MIISLVGILGPPQAPDLAQAPEGAFKVPGQGRLKLRVLGEYYRLVPSSEWANPNNYF